MGKETPARLGADQEAAWRAFLKAHAFLARRLDRDLRDCCQMTLADPFHVVRVANRCLDQVRRRVQSETLGHRI